MKLLNFLYIGFGGFSGAICRYLFYCIFKKNSFPHATFIVNVLGCLLIGFLYGILDIKQIFNDYAKSFVFVGFLGSFTTFSTFMHDNYNLLKSQNIYFFLLNLVLQIVLGLFFVWLGYLISKSFC